MSLTRRELIKFGVLTAAGIAMEGCLPKTETPILKNVTPIKISKDGSSKIEPLWKESAYREQAFGKIYEESKGEKCVAKSNVEARRTIYLKDPGKKPFYDTQAGIEPAYGEVVTLYREYQNPHLLWPLTQEYKTLGFLNVFLIGGYQDFPQEARTLKTNAQGQVSAEANVIRVLEDGNQQFAGLEIEEAHYGFDGKPVFRATSMFDKNMIKVAETNIKGEKLEEYYFSWPKSKK